LGQIKQLGLVIREKKMAVLVGTLWPTMPHGFSWAAAAVLVTKTMAKAAAVATAGE
jgi:hypothetical protein